jgi:hypothetical protein
MFHFLHSASVLNQLPVVSSDIVVSNVLNWLGIEICVNKLGLVVYRHFFSTARRAAGVVARRQQVQMPSKQLYPSFVRR